MVRASESFTVSSATVPAAKRGGAVMVLVGIAIAVAGWRYLPGEAGLVGFVLLAQKVVLSAAGAAFVAVGLGIGWRDIRAEFDQETKKVRIFHKVFGIAIPSTLEVGCIERAHVVRAAGPGTSAPGVLEIYQRGESTPLRFGMGIKATALETLAAWIRERFGVAAEPAPTPEEQRRARSQLDGCPFVRAFWQPSGVCIEAPAPGLRGFPLAMALAGLAGSVVFGLAAAAAARENPDMPAAAVAAAVAFPLVFMVLGLHMARRSVTITVENGTVRTRSTGLIPPERSRLWPGGTVVDASMVEMPTGKGQRRQSCLVLFGPGRVPIQRLQHPLLDAHPEYWDAVAAAVREFLPRAD